MRNKDNKIYLMIKGISSKARANSQKCIWFLIGKPDYIFLAGYSHGAHWELKKSIWKKEILLLFILFKSFSFTIESFLSIRK